MPLVVSRTARRRRPSTQRVRETLVASPLRWRLLAVVLAIVTAISLVADRATAEDVPADKAAADSASTTSELRTWSARSGGHSVEAAMIDYADGKVKLRRPDGQELEIELGRLSRGDQAYVRKEVRRRIDAAKATGSTGASARAGELPAVASPGDWPCWRGALRDGKSPDTGLLKQWPEGGPPRLWHARGLGLGYSTVSVVDDTVYTCGDVEGKMMIFAFDMEGNVKWRVPHDNAWTKNYSGTRTTPTIDGDNLYVLSGHGLVGCYDAGRGTPKWSRSLKEFGGSPPNWGYSESVLILGDLAIVTPGGKNCIVALNKNTGEPVWSSQGFDGGPQYSSCYPFTFGGKTLVANGTHGGIVCVDASNGQVQWANPFAAGNTANIPTPGFADGFVFWANGYGAGGICMKLAAGRGLVTAQPAWTTKDMNCHHGGFIIHEGHIYGNHGPGYACLDLETGQTLWKERAVGKGSLCFADGMLYLFGEREGRAALATCSPKGLEIRGEMQVDGEGTSWAHPVVIGGRLYLRYADNLYCFDVKAK